MDFDLPDAKRYQSPPPLPFTTRNPSQWLSKLHSVRRSDLYTSRSPSSSPEPAADPTLASALHSRLAALYGPIPPPDPFPSNPTHTPKASADADADAQPEPEEPQQPQESAPELEFEFRLFSAPTHSNDKNIQAQKIILADSSPELGEGGFVTRERDRRFYIAEPVTGERKERFAVAAVSGEEVVRLARRRAWGLEVPWRVTAIRVTSTSVAKVKANASSNLALKTGQSLQCGQGEVEVEVDPGEKGKGKPGKKRRIILRERRRKAVQREEAKREERESKEEAEREKRTRRNREKKVKRKMKEKASKAGVPAGASGSGSE
jgi:hypothetical protein